MEQREFESMTGASVTAQRYSEIERIYMAAPSVDKEIFCKEWKKHRLDELETVVDAANNALLQERRVRDIKAKLEASEEVRGVMCDQMKGLREQNRKLEGRLKAASEAKEALALAMLKAGMDAEVTALLGEKESIRLKCAAGMELSVADLAFIAGEFGQKD